MARSRSRQPLAILTAVLLTCGVLVATPGAAFAEAPTPTVETPVFGDPVPGSTVGDADAGSGPLSSITVPTPDAPKPMSLESTDVVLEQSDVGGVTTEAAEGSAPATVVGEWKALGDTGIAIAPASGTDDDAERVSEDAPDDAGDRNLDAVAIPTTSVAVGILDEKAAGKKGLDGIVVSLSQENAGKDGEPVAVRLPDELLAGAYGGDFAGRLEWVQVPASTKAEDIAEKAVPVASVSTDEGLVLTPNVSKEPMMLAALSGASSANGTGSYAATPLKSSSTWDVAEQTGAFTWSYDMAVPAPGAGPAPSVGLS
ncbi:hypothetical protein, partial [Microbacterium sp. BF1]